MTTNQSDVKKNLETFSLIWLDEIVNDSLENVETQQRLRTMVNHFKTFQRADQCIQYMQSAPKDRFILIVSGRLGHEVVPQIHHLRQVYSIYVYCRDKERNERWAKKYSKIQHVITKFDDLVSRIRTNREKFVQTKINEPLFIIFFLTNNENNESNDSFLYSQFFVDYLLNIQPMTTDDKELVSLCKDEYKGNESELNIIREFEESYSSEQALWWYTRDAFLYRLLNKAFRVQNFDLLLIFRFFIRDIQRLIEQNSSSSSICVYRSYIMSNDELQTFHNSLGEFLTINGFFIANLHRQQTLSYLNHPNLSGDNEKVLFEIAADSQIEPAKPFCSLTSLSYCSTVEQIIFSLGTIFRLDTIHQQEDRIWIIRMRLTTGKHQKLKAIFDYLKAPYLTEEVNLLSFGRALRKMNKYDEAEKFYRRLLKELPSTHVNLVDCHYNLGLVLDEKGDYESSLEWHQKAIEIKKQTAKNSNVPYSSLGYNYNSIANVYQKKGDYKQAKDYYQKTLDLWKKIYGENHLDLAMCWNNLGCLFENQKKYSQALECHEKSLAIKKSHLPENHLSLSLTHNNLACLYGILGQMDSALEHLQLTLQIQTKAFAINHPEIATTYKNLGLAQEIQGDWNQAKTFYEKSAQIRRRSLPATHPDVLQIEQDLRRIGSKVK